MAPPISLRANFAWTFAGNTVYAAGQWVILSLFAKLGGSEMLGQYAYAVAVTAPVVMLSHLNLRAVLATDVGNLHSFGDYLSVRGATTAVSLVVIVCVAMLVGGDWNQAIAIVAMGLAQCAETVSDLCYGAMQRREQMAQVARSLMARTAVSIAFLFAALWMTRSVVWAVVALAAGRLAVLLAFDLRVGSKGEDLSVADARSQWRVFRTALPLGLILMLISLNTNLPRYAIEHMMGAASLGVFAAVVSFITIGATIVNALGQSATPRLARHYGERERRQFLGIIYRMTALAIGLGMAGVFGAWLLGGIFLRLLYRPEFAQYSGLLAATMAAGTLSYVAITLGYGVTSARLFDVQLPLFGASAACCGVASWLLTPLLGLYGGLVAIALAALVQIIGQVFILRRSLGGWEPNA